MCYQVMHAGELSSSYQIQLEIVKHIAIGG